eukprot:NODE_3238_length_413_cov_6.782967_g2712_i0.p2 GENE.NODE_3238_length_413_cov_6.782967_g2712_i0~~NODE_3238_length_413_cov_6.782967_g2712_i0.p2  ORF type:complete len:53 (-),score=1.45 NODE_3238_length_413_cov_6.782967_g2712_i0:46-204(-)
MENGIFGDFFKGSSSHFSMVRERTPGAPNLTRGDTTGIMLGGFVSSPARHKI